MTRSGPQPIVWKSLPPGLVPVLAAAVSPDGQYAACGRANQIFIYDLPGKRLVTRLTDPSLIQTADGALPGIAHRDLVQSLAFSPDGKFVASGGFREIKIWQRPEPTVRVNLADARVKSVNAVACSADGKLLAAAGDDNIIRLYQLPAGTAAGELQGHHGPVVALHFAADSTRLYSASSDQSLRSWDTVARIEIARVEMPSPLTAMALLGNGMLVTGSADNAMRVVRRRVPPERSRLPAVRQQPSQFRPTASGLRWPALMGKSASLILSRFSRCPALMRRRQKIFLSIQQANPSSSARITS